jgi:hypothetical protein
MESITSLEDFLVCANEVAKIAYDCVSGALKSKESGANAPIKDFYEKHIKGQDPIKVTKEFIEEIIALKKATSSQANPGPLQNLKEAGLRANLKLGTISMEACKELHQGLDATNLEESILGASSEEKLEFLPYLSLTNGILLDIVETHKETIKSFAEDGSKVLNLRIITYTEEDFEEQATQAKEAQEALTAAEAKAAEAKAKQELEKAETEASGNAKVTQEATEAVKAAKEATEAVKAAKKEENNVVSMLQDKYFLMPNISSDKAQELFNGLMKIDAVKPEQIIKFIIHAGSANTKSRY